MPIKSWEFVLNKRFRHFKREIKAEVLFTKCKVSIKKQLNISVITKNVDSLIIVTIIIIIVIITLLGVGTTNRNVYHWYITTRRLVKHELKRSPEKRPFRGISPLFGESFNYFLNVGIPSSRLATSSHTARQCVFNRSLNEMYEFV